MPYSFRCKTISISPGIDALWKRILDSILEINDILDICQKTIPIEFRLENMSVMMGNNLKMFPNKLIYRYICRKWWHVFFFFLFPLNKTLLFSEVKPFFLPTVLKRSLFWNVAWRGPKSVHPYKMKIVILKLLLKSNVLKIQIMVLKMPRITPNYGITVISVFL